MSTKIYNGFKLKITDIFELHEKMNELRAEFKPMVKSKMVDFFVDIVAHSIDHNTLHPSGNSFSPYQLAFNKFNEQQEEVRTRRFNDSFVDYSFALCIFPFEGNFYGMYYTNQQDFAEIWKDKPYVEDFHYQNQSDQPEEISEEEWNERERIWNGILDINDIPSLNGFEYKIVLEETYDYPNVQEVINALPSFEKRVEEQAKNESYTTFLKGKTVSTNNVMKMFREFREYCETDEGKRVMEENRIRVSNNLKKYISHEMVMGK